MHPRFPMLVYPASLHLGEIRLPCDMATSNDDADQRNIDTIRRPPAAVSQLLLLPNIPNTKTIHVPHLGGIEASYQTPGLSTSKPTLVLVNSFTTSSELYKTQYANKNLTDKMNLLAIELLGHGQTRCKVENWTYWDTAWMNIQVLQELEKRGEIDQSKGVFVLGTSQGGWITVRMALLAPDKVSSPSRSHQQDDCV
jgi:pimeloyl-ACP methyl ester carboxylesterase